MAEIERIHTMLEQTLGAERFPNSIGPQRFGSGRPVTAEVGRHVIAGRFEDAVMTYLSMPGAVKRLTWRPSVRACERRGITEEVIESCPDWMDFERRMATHLLRKARRSRRCVPTLAEQPPTDDRPRPPIGGVQPSPPCPLGGRTPLATPVEGDLVGRVDERGQLEAKGCVTVQGRTAGPHRSKLHPRPTDGDRPPSGIRRWDMRRPRPVPSKRRSWKTWALMTPCGPFRPSPRLSKGTRRALVTGFKEFTWETVPKASEDTLDGRWAEGPVTATVGIQKEPASNSASPCPAALTPRPCCVNS